MYFAKIIDCFLGIEVRYRKSTSLMHHKFLIIDESLLMDGSLNWTMHGVTSNWEDITITSQSCMVEPLVKEFNEVWEILGQATDS